MPRKKKFEKPVYSNKDGIRFATPEIVAKYRAKRLKCGILADISCGIGGQTIYFAKECDQVYAVEIDPKKIEYAKKNCKRHGLDNVTFICGDALSPEVIAQIPEVDVVFSDPYRPATEEKRKITSLEPGIPNVMELYSEKTANFAFEAPPQITPERIPFDCEREYMSLEGNLNRLTLYFGNLNRCERSAVTLPSQERIESAGKAVILKEVEELGTYAYEPEPSVVKAELLPQLAGSLQEENVIAMFQVDKKRTLLTSDSLFRSPMFKNHYKVLHIAEFDPETINKSLKENDIGRVILRAGVDPADYWSVRSKIEEGLTGSKTVHLFVKDSTAMVCEII